jgi:hypothetical protein
MEQATNRLRDVTERVRYIGRRIEILRMKIREAYEEDDIGTLQDIRERALPDVQTQLHTYWAEIGCLQIRLEEDAKLLAGFTHDLAAAQDEMRDATRDLD